MEDLRDTEMLTAGPIRKALDELRALRDEASEFAPGSAIFLERARTLKLVETAINRARTETPMCDSEEAAFILGVSERQARNLARSGAIEAHQRVDRGPWTFDVRSCHAYAARRGAA